MENLRTSTKGEEERFRKEAEQVLELVDGFALMREYAQESDKRAFIDAYIDFRLEQLH